MNCYQQIHYLIHVLLKETPSYQEQARAFPQDELSQRSREKRHDHAEEFMRPIAAPDLTMASQGTMTTPKVGSFHAGHQYFALCWQRGRVLFR